MTEAEIEARIQRIEDCLREIATNPWVGSNTLREIVRQTIGSAARVRANANQTGD